VAFVATTLAKGTLGEFEVFNHFVLPNMSEDDRKIWLSLQKTKGSSDLYVQSNVWQPTQPGHPVASAGWHSHPGHSLIIVTAGTLTNQEGDDPACTPTSTPREWHSSITAAGMCTSFGTKVMLWPRT
jgi:hypothetical protein